MVSRVGRERGTLPKRWVDRESNRETPNPQPVLNFPVTSHFSVASKAASSLPALGAVEPSELPTRRHQATCRRHPRCMVGVGRITELRVMKECLLLIVTQGEPAGASIEVGLIPSLVGRAADCNLPIQDLMTSRYHCQVWFDGDRYFVQDLDAMNQTFLNGVPVTVAEIREGDELRLGITTVMLVSVETAARMAVLFSKATAVGRVETD